MTKNRIDTYDLNKTNAVIEWCSTNLKNKEWSMEAISMFPMHYKFELKDSRMFTLAVLSV